MLRVLHRWNCKHLSFEYIPPFLIVTDNFSSHNHLFLITPHWKWSYNQYPPLFTFHQILIHKNFLTTKMDVKILILTFSWFLKHGVNYSMKLFLLTNISLLMTVISDMIVLIFLSIGVPHHIECAISGLKYLTLATNWLLYQWFYFHEGFMVNMKI